MTYHINNSHLCNMTLQLGQYQMYSISNGWTTKEQEQKKNEDNLIKYLNSHEASRKAIFIGSRVNATSREISKELFDRLKKEAPLKFFTPVSRKPGGRQTV